MKSADIKAEYEKSSIFEGDTGTEAERQSSENAYGRTALIYSKEKVDRSVVKRQLAPVLDLALKATDAERVEADESVLRGYYTQTVELLVDFINSVMPERDKVILILRTLAQTPATLKTLSDKLGISREFVRQLENKRWYMITGRFKKSSLSVFVPWRKGLCDILLGIDASHFIQAMAYFLKENVRVGEMLIRVTTPEERSEDYKSAIYQYNFKEESVMKYKNVVREKINTVPSFAAAKCTPKSDGVLSIRQSGYFYDVSGNDALILNKHLG